MAWSLQRRGRALAGLVTLLALGGQAGGAGFDEKYHAAEELRNQGKYAEAARAFGEAYEAGRAEGRPVAHVLCSVGNLYRTAGQVEKARHAYDRCVSDPGVSAAIKAQAQQALAGLPVPPAPRKRMPVKGATAAVTLPKGALPQTEARAALVPIAGGTFTMGSPASEEGHYADEVPHQVTISHGFWLGRTEVTQDQYTKVMGTNPSKFQGADLPVEQVSWDDAVAYCNKLSAQEQLEACYQIKGSTVTWSGLGCKGYRLPTEAEWEYAARAGEGLIYAGSNEPDAVAWYGHPEDQTHPVAKKQANRWGLYDMSGNVWEWVWDWYGVNYDVKQTTDPIGPASGSNRVNRGGSFGDSPRYLHVADRSGSSPGGRTLNQGFRLARSLP